MPLTGSAARAKQGSPTPWKSRATWSSYLTACGASLVVLPERLADRQGRRGLHGQADENAAGPDQLDLVLRLLHRQGYSAWLELNLEGKDALPGLPPADSPEALRQGLVRIDRQGLADGPCYHPLHPEVRQAMKRRVGGSPRRAGRGSELLGAPAPAWPRAHPPGQPRHGNG